jgi:hypothetical protein
MIPRPWALALRELGYAGSIADPGLSAAKHGARPLVIGRRTRGRPQPAAPGHWPSFELLEALIALTLRTERQLAVLSGI